MSGCNGFLPIDVIPACAMNTGATTTFIHLGVTVGGLKTFWALAVKSILLIHTCPSISTGA